MNIQTMLDNFEIIDLTQEICPEMPVNFGLPNTVHTVIQKHKTKIDSQIQDSFYVGNIAIAEHSGTHVDSVSHVSADRGALHIDQMDMSFFCGRGIAIDFDNIDDNSYITLEDVKNRLAYYELNINNGDIFLYTYGHYKKYYPTKKYLTAYSGLEQKAAEYIYNECGAINIGTDAPSIDKHGSPYPCHYVCRKYGKANTENLCNIEKLAGKFFCYIGLPLKIKNGSGSPIRAIALLEKS